MTLTVKDITPLEAYQRIEELGLYSCHRVQIIDVRERHEIETFGKIEASYNVPFSVYESNRDMFTAALIDLVDKEATVIIYCRSGRRSGIVSKYAAEELGFNDVYNVVGGLNQWTDDRLPIKTYANDHSPWVHTIFEHETATAQYIVTDIVSKETYIIDPVLDYDPLDAVVQPRTAKLILEHVNRFGLNVTKIIDTHVHADHLTAAIYLKEQLPSNPEFCIGSNVVEVQKTFLERYNLPPTAFTMEHFDRLVKEDDTWTLGDMIHCSVIATPGHTPACMSYRIGDAAFVGDTLFMPDIGTARCDFPGGSAEQMYTSIHKMYKLWPNGTRIYVGHDYPPATSLRTHMVMTLLGVHKKLNKMIDEEKSMDEYVKLRSERDATLRVPRFIHPSLQVNLRGGLLPQDEPSVHGKATPQTFIKVPIRFRT
ncbi:hypothetical protein O0I10_009189 [Lichtheimia ornata]|uniref:Rhodanese domain-containing protein n=1 Tax=Lichtheimia ornata TaxID=688661 RepID=A0AAD7UYB5_9FUNG|nr:uncharacterized protein O0I10_009189 [Lichtheimia ornata]KAJ8655154.1 hypothetical protein O0I10_009189 [Lichtheimia ornata]